VREQDDEEGIETKKDRDDKERIGTMNSRLKDSYIQVSDRA